MPHYVAEKYSRPSRLSFRRRMCNQPSLCFRHMCIEKVDMHIEWGFDKAVETEGVGVEAVAKVAVVPKVAKVAVEVLCTSE